MLHSLMVPLAYKKVGDPLAFYSVVATILPVLFFAILYQAQFYRSLIESPATTTPLWSPVAKAWCQYVITALATVFALGGEIVALRVLFHQHATPHESQWVK